jgi:hypothetical protein
MGEELPELAPLHIHPEDGNCNVCQNFGSYSTFDVAHTQKPMLYTELQPQKTKDKNNLKSVYFAYIHSIMSWLSSGEI